MRCAKIILPYCTVCLALALHGFTASAYLVPDIRIAAVPNNVAANLGGLTTGFSGLGSPSNFVLPTYNSFAGLPPIPSSSSAHSSASGFGRFGNDDFSIRIRQALAQGGFATGPTEYSSPLTFRYPFSTPIRFQSLPPPQPQSNPAITSLPQIHPTGIDFLHSLRFISAPLPVQDTRQLAAIKGPVDTTKSIRVHGPSNPNDKLRYLLKDDSLSEPRYLVKDERQVRVLQVPVAAASSNPTGATTASPLPFLKTSSSPEISTPTPSEQPQSVSGLYLELRPPSLSSSPSFEYTENQNSPSSSSSSSSSQSSNNDFGPVPVDTTNTATNPLPDDSYSVTGSSYRESDSVSGGSISAQKSLRISSYSAVPSISYSLPSDTYPAEPTNVNTSSRSLSVPVASGSNMAPYSAVPDNYYTYRGSDSAGWPIVPYSSPTPLSGSDRSNNSNNNRYNEVVQNSIPSDLQLYPDSDGTPISSVYFRSSNSISANSYGNSNSVVQSSSPRSLPGNSHSNLKQANGNFYGDSNLINSNSKRESNNVATSSNKAQLLLLPYYSNNSGDYKNVQ